MRGGYQSRDRHGPGSERTVAFSCVNEYHPYRGADRYIPRARPISREPYSHRFSSFRHHGPSYRERQPPRQNERRESGQDEERSIARPNAPALTLRSTNNRVLSDEDVIAVAEWVTRWLDHGFYLENQKKISAFVRHYMHMINHPNKDVGVSDSFYGRLSPRSRELSNRVEQACKIWKEQIKLKNENKTAKEDRLAKFPALLRGLERTLDVSPDRVFVFGDTGFLTVMSLENQNLRVEASARNEGDHRRIASAIICASNDGQYLSPYLVSKTEAVNKKPAHVSKAFVSFAAKPWVNTEFFNDWLEKVFEPETKRLAGNKRERLARLLLVDGQLYDITPSTFMNCWSKGIYLVCIPHKGSPFFNPLECTVFSKMHEIYATEMAEKFRKASGMLTVSYRFVANSLVEQLQRQLLRGALKAGWRKSHLYISDHDALRKHVRRIPATPAPVTPIKTRARTLAQSQLDQAVPISPPSPLSSLVSDIVLVNHRTRPWRSLPMMSAIWTVNDGRSLSMKCHLSSAWPEIPDSPGPVVILKRLHIFAITRYPLKTQKALRTAQKTISMAMRNTKMTHREVAPHMKPPAAR
ncbi:hypothetical protein PDE_04307 [Penicillium oxalicum 114-2]|uniref:DDE-1 domain-containing protein n=1 Tax=Penicillium oxalicum (strain 114-2 / CGMCC 5302) TaxID=933388 RepID=S8ATD7_PENO1|nr:hypothetical protein PDE_04307 [Penicillium oxalicum 114-2]